MVFCPTTPSSISVRLSFGNRLTTHFAAILFREALDLKRGDVRAMALSWVRWPHELKHSSPCSTHYLCQQRLLPEAGGAGVEQGSSGFAHGQFDRGGGALPLIGRTQHPIEGIDRYRFAEQIARSV